MNLNMIKRRLKVVSTSLVLFIFAMAQAVAQSSTRSHKTTADLIDDAQRGDMRAQADLGYRYYRGLYISQNLPESVRWFLKAAEQGDAVSQNNLGAAYENGEGISEDKLEAARWYEKSAAQGHRYGQYNLARMYEKGTGVPVDKLRAAELYELAARQMFVDAQYKLARMLSSGDGLVRDPVKSYAWLILASQQAESMAWKRGAKPPTAVRALTEKMSLAETLSPTQIAEATSLATQWTPRRFPSN